MHTLSCATVALFAFFAAAKAEAPTDRSLPFADIADPAARAAFEAMAREIGGLKTSVKDLSGELDAQKTHSAAVEARLGKAEAALGQEEPVFRRQAQAAPTRPNTTVVHLHHVTINLRADGFSGMTGPDGLDDWDGGGQHRRMQPTSVIRKHPETGWILSYLCLVS